MHLLAQRCESTYARFLTIVGCSDRDFPRPRSRLGHGASWMGIGPYLGQQEKFVVLVTATAEDFGRYTQAFLGERFRWPRRFDLGWNRGLFFGTSIDFEGNLRDDTALHCHVVYNLAQNFCDAYRHFRRQNKAVFIAEYRNYNSNLCQQAASAGYQLQFFKRDLKAIGEPCR